MWCLFVINFFRHFRSDPVSLNIKEKLLAIMFCFIVILSIALLTEYMVNAALYPILVASMGASAVILLIIPSSPLAQPWPFVGGQIVSAIIGVACAQFIVQIPIAAACAVGGSVFVMLLLQCLHPPGAATALAPVLAGASISSLGFDFVLFPVAINVVIMLCLCIIINRWIMQREYPVYFHAQRSSTEQDKTPAALNLNISEQDINQVLQQSSTFVDVTANEIGKLLFQAEQVGYKRTHTTISCADIMQADIVTLEYGTEVQDAWELMYRQKLKAVPVIDRANRVIGIVTWNDFFKFLNLSAYDTVQEKFRAFICRTLELKTDKPESIGHLMTKSVTVMEADNNITDLIPLMTGDTGLKQIPIVNHEQRLVGLVHQSQLLAGLYNQKKVSD